MPGASELQMPTTACHGCKSKILLKKSLLAMSEEHFLCKNPDGTVSSPTTTGFQPLPGDTDAHSRSAGVVTHGALLKSYNLNKQSMLPLAFLITPMAPQPSLVLRRQPLRCQSCDAAFSFASAFGSFQQMRWQCAFCHASNAFPSASCSPLPEYSPAMPCVEYIESHINTNAAAVLCAPTVIFCVDGNLRPREMLQVRLHSTVVQTFSQQSSAR